MTSTFRLSFTRYDRKTCTRTQGAPQFISGDGFRGAFLNASLIMMGLNAANPILTGVNGVKDGPRYEYDIASLSAEGLGGENVQNDLHGMFADHKPAEEEV